MLREINQFLQVHCGTTHKVIENIMTGNPREYRSIFFQPIQSPYDLLKRTLDIFTAPPCYAILFIEYSCLALFYAAKSLLDLLNSNSAVATADIKMAGKFALYSLTAIVGYLVSDVLNFVDLIGSIAVTLSEEDDIPHAAQPF